MRQGRSTPVGVDLSERLHYEMSERVSGMPHGGLGAAHQVVMGSRPIEQIDEGVHVLRQHRRCHGTAC